MDVDAYLQRIAYHGPRTPDADTLRRLHICNMMSVPFENLDIHLGRKIVLEEERFYGKIVGQKRGGFCYELNGLFAWLLREIGFTVSLCSARVFQDGEPGPEFDHLVLIVHLDERWLADVGFGDSFVEPLRLNETGEQMQFGTAYRLHRNERGLTLLRRKKGMAEEPQYTCDTIPRSLSEFAGMCNYHQTSPQSHFTHKRVCSRATPEGRVTISDNRLIFSANGARTERELQSVEYRAALKEYFGIDLGSSVSDIASQSI